MPSSWTSRRLKLPDDAVQQIDEGSEGTQVEINVWRPTG